MKLFIIYTFALFMLSACSGVNYTDTGQNIYVAVNGSDENPGTYGRPFSSLERAREEVKLRKATGPVTVWLRRGTYYRSKAFELNEQDSGSENAPINYRAMEGEEVRIVGGTEISGFQFLPDMVGYEQIDPTIRTNVLAVDLNKYGISALTYNKAPGSLSTLGIRDIGVELFFNKENMPVAHWPNNGWTNIVAVTAGRMGGRFTYEGDRPSRWSRLDNILLDGYWNYDWDESFYRVMSINTDNREIQTNLPPGNYGFKAGQRYRALNVLEELDEPGEWYLDKTTGFLFFWPPADVNKNKITISFNDDPFVSMSNTSFVTFRNIIFESTHGSGIEIIGGNNNLIAGCVLRHIGTVGIAIGAIITPPGYLYFNPEFSGNIGRFNGVVGCEIHDTGWNGVMLGGGDRLTLRAGLNVVKNNNIYNTGLKDKTNSPSVLLYGVGNTLANNLIHDVPGQAIGFWGNNHVIEYNEIFGVVQEVADAGAMYTGRDFSQRGTIIRYNLFHDIVGISGGHIAVYLDDCASGITVFGNIFYKVNFAINIGGGRDNTIENNIFVDCPISVHMDARGLTWMKYYFDGSNSTLFDRLELVKYNSPPYSTSYPELVDIQNDQPAIPKGNKIIRNLFSENNGPMLIDGVDQYLLLSDNLIKEDIGFITIEKAGLLLTEESDAWKIGFKPIPRDRIGLYKDEYRNSLP